MPLPGTIFEIFNTFAASLVWVRVFLVWSNTHYILAYCVIQGAELFVQAIEPVANVFVSKKNSIVWTGVFQQKQVYVLCNFT